MPKKYRTACKSQRYQKRYKDPGLIATSLPHFSKAAQRVMKLSAQRLQIEDTFRDLKNHRHGFGLHSARTCDPKRRETLLLIATLAMLILWLTGLAAKAKDWSRYFQVNTERKRDVLSIFFLGWQVLRKTQFRITQTDLITARNWLPEIAI